MSKHNSHSLKVKRAINLWVGLVQLVELNWINLVGGPNDQKKDSFRTQYSLLVGLGMSKEKGQPKLTLT